MGRIVHIGLGNFARAHLLDYTQDAGGWDVIGVSLRSAGVRDGLREHGFDYDLCVQGVGTKRISVIKDVLVAPENPQAVLDAMAEADIISATVTEKGYHLTPEGELNLGDPSIIDDLNGKGPATLIGFLAVALSKTKRPITVLSCDNRVENGTTLQAAVARFADHAGLKINWDTVRFPNAMVDRITPATTDALRTSSGDPMAVPTEAFREWVIEDNFGGPRPDWPQVQFVDDVASHEMRKLRMLNGAHSLLAYAGVTRGHEFVHQAVADTELHAEVLQLMSEAGSTLPLDVQEQVPSYAEALIDRFENPELEHRLRQIAMDGSQKVPVRFFGTLRAAPQSAAIKSGIRAWVNFCISETEQGTPLDDPLAADIAKCARSDTPLQGLLTLVGGADLIPLFEA